jgi:type IV pilus assembly protein PilF
VLGVSGALVLYGCSNPLLIRRQHRAAVYNTELGVAYLQRGALALAKEKLDQAQRENPDSPSVQSARALLFERLGEPARAERAFRRALALAPHDPDYQNDYAVYLCSNGQYARGVKYFLEAARNPLYLTPADALDNAGVCLRAEHQDATAIKMFKAALSINPGFSSAVWELADLDYKHGRLQQAHSELVRYLSTHHETANLLLLAVQVMQAQGDTLDAVLYARRLQLDYPDSPQAHALAKLGLNSG